MSKKSSDQRYEISFGDSDHEVEDGFLVLRPVIKIGPFHHYPFMILLRDVLCDRIGEVVSITFKKYFYVSSPPSGEDKK